MSLKTEFDYYLNHHQELASQFDGKVIVIKDRKVIGSYASAWAAVKETAKSHKIGTFLTQRVTTDDSGHTERFHSRVSFV